MVLRNVYRRLQNLKGQGEMDNNVRQTKGGHHFPIVFSDLRFFYD